jgi:deoxyribonuclease (pyrimidine dimer)
MTRINLIPPSELANQHAFAEWREIKMIPKALARSLRTQSTDKVLKKIPRNFTLNTGHVCFFYDKGAYLRHRYEELTTELEKRGYKINKEAEFDPDDTMNVAPWNGDYEPTDEAYTIIRQRIAEKIAIKPTWYTFFYEKEN